MVTSAVGPSCETYSNGEDVFFSMKKQGDPGSCCPPFYHRHLVKFVSKNQGTTGAYIVGIFRSGRVFSNSKVNCLFQCAFPQSIGRTILGSC